MYFCGIDASAFGRKMLERMGWRPGSGLGANEDGSVAPLPVSFKDDLKGLGVRDEGKVAAREERWMETASAFQDVLSRLSPVGEQDEKGKGNEKEKEKRKEKGKGKEKQKEKEKEKEKERTKDKKERTKDKGKEKRNKDKIKKQRKEKRSTASARETEPASTGPAAMVRRAHRAKFMRNKAVSMYSETHLQEILGGLKG